MYTLVNNKNYSSLQEKHIEYIIKMKPIIPKSRAIVLMLVLVVTTSSLVHEVKSHACGSTFFSALVQMIPCRQAVAPFTPVPPTEACCAAINGLGQPCLCVLVNGPPIAGVDRAMAMQLPQKCSANFEPCETAK